jgi:prepilin-type N-terminal cleavage/methylation domain-containing protein
MRIYTVPMPIRNQNIKANFKDSAFTLIEIVVVISIFSAFVVLAQMNLTGMFRKNTFKGQVQKFISTMQMAANAASQSDRRYEVIIDLTEQKYILREITTPDLFEVLEEEIIVENDFSKKCQVSYVQFDDLVETGEIDDSTSTLIAMFRAGHAGWQNGGKIVLLDDDDQPYTVLVNRLNRTITLKKGDIEILMPKRKDELPF